MVNLTSGPLRGDVEVDETCIEVLRRVCREVANSGSERALVLVAVEKRGHTSGRSRMATSENGDSQRRKFGGAVG